MGEVVNLRRARKAQDRHRREAEAETKRLAFGRAKAERDLNRASAGLERAKLEAHRLEGRDAPSSDDDAART